MKDAEEKMSSLLIMEDVTACLKNLEIRKLINIIIYQPAELTLIDHMPCAELQRYAPRDPENDQPPSLLQAPEQEGDGRDLGGAHISR